MMPSGGSLAAWIAGPLLAFWVAAGAAVAGPAPAATGEAAADRPAPAPLPTRQGPQPLQLIRPLVQLQDRIAGGYRQGIAAQGALVRSIAKQLTALEGEVWKDARNRTALFKYVLSGGDPAVLRMVAQLGAFAESELDFARGVLANAEGHRKAALEYLKKTDCRQVEASLAGHVALVQAVLHAESDTREALRLADEARLLSPGTLIEEAALRVSIELAAAMGARARVERYAIRYFRRFPQSPYAQGVMPNLAAYFGAQGFMSSDDEARWLDQIAAIAGRERIFALLRLVSEEALRSGQLRTAAYAARRARKTDPESKAVWLELFEAAAIVVDKNPAAGVEALTRAEARGPAAAERELADVVRLVADFIDAPAEPQAADPGSEAPGAKGTPTSSGKAGSARSDTSFALPERSFEEGVAPVVGRAQAALERSDKLLQETVR
jgi:chemotaxis protein MotC